MNDVEEIGGKGGRVWKWNCLYLLWKIREIAYFALFQLSGLFFLA